jgi:sensor histidine kinase YesM
VSYLFGRLNPAPALDTFYRKEFEWYAHNLFSKGIRGADQLIDVLAFFSILFLRWAFENEQKRSRLERDHLVLQLETLKAQLHPHFLFNTLNSLYGMSLMGDGETPAYILRLSDMMRYVLYDCQGNQVPLDKDLAFVRNYLEMEKKRYPAANISFEIVTPHSEKAIIAPLLLIPFLENSFKHGSQRITDSGFIRGMVDLSNGNLHFYLVNGVLGGGPLRQAPYGGVGISNVRKRLALYYPERHTLAITSNEELYSVDLTIQL